VAEKNRKNSAGTAIISRLTHIQGKKYQKIRHGCFFDKRQRIENIKERKKERKKKRKKIKKTAPTGKEKKKNKEEKDEKKKKT
jgi:hypothetical protein